MSVTNDAEVLIVGAGPAGLGAAIGLAGAGVRGVTVLERDLASAGRVGEVMPPNAVVPLARLGLWDDFLADGHLACAGVSTWWGRESRRDWDYIRSPHGNGWFIDRRRMIASLIKRAVSLGVRVLNGRRVAGVARTDDGKWKVLVGEGSRGSLWYTAQFLVNAAGRSALFDNALGRRQTHDSMVGLVGYGGINRFGSWEPRLWLEGTCDGWWYSAPLPAGRCVAVFLTDPDLIDGDLSAVYQRAARVARNTSVRLADCSIQGRLNCVKAGTSRSSRFVGESILSIGDAAYSSDPLRGHGIYNCLSMAAVCIEPIQRSLAGEPAALRSVEQELESSYAAYCDGLGSRYRTEGRWPDAPFWRRRSHDAVTA